MAIRTTLMGTGLPSRSRKTFYKKPLRQTNGNARKRPRVEKSPRLVQMQIDLGRKMHKTCQVCGMEYIPSNSEDATLHKKFHNMKNDGVPLSRAFMDTSQKRNFAGAREAQCIVAVSRSDPKLLRNQAQEVLQIANKELGATDIEEKLLWGQHVKVGLRKNDDSASSEETSPDQDSDSSTEKTRSDRFKLYLFLRNKKCIGLCLAEHISRAHKVVASDENAQILQDPKARSSAIAISKEAEPALLGVSRIWTSKAHRHEGVATALLNCVAENFIYGMRVPQSQIAFSQPSESGGALARKWFGRDYGWHVYT